MTMITFIRLRPADTVGERWAESRRREGSTTVEVAALTEADRVAAFSGGLLPSTGEKGSAVAPAYVAGPAGVLTLSEQGIPGWQLTVVAGDDRATTIDALARTQAAFLRIGRSRVAEGAQIAALPGVDPRVSVFVDTVEESLAAVEAGATDLLLRGWSTDTIGKLRDDLPFPLVERTALPVGVTVEEARDHLEPDALKAYLDLVDASGVVRSRTDWAPGKDLPAPHAPGRLSAQWTDDAWASESHLGAGDAVRGELRRILDRSLEGHRPSRDEVQRLF
ncbi:MAG: hypothetical protein U9R47_05200, partial [Actinomycetota bacterium]|nr:hypothetical protein [Actinomycetota bacterium]